MSQLSIKRVSHSFSERVLSSVDLDVNSGELIALIGPSGCGKTTLLRLVAGFEELQAGEIHLDGKSLSGVPTHKRNIGVVFQSYALFPHLNNRENISFGLKNKRSSAIEEMAERLSILSELDRYPHEISGGQQQRVALARSLVCKPKIILLDEPFSNLDEQLKQNLIPEIRRHLKELGMTALIVTHDAKEAFAFADKLAILKDGKILQFGTAAELYSNPSCLFSAMFLGSGQEVDGQLIGLDAKKYFLRPEDLEICHGNEFSIHEVIFSGTHQIVVLKSEALEKVSVSLPIGKTVKIGDRVGVKCLREKPPCFD